MFMYPLWQSCFTAPCAGDSDRQPWLKPWFCSSLTVLSSALLLESDLVVLHS